MKIDWKQLAATPGYRLFKSKYTEYRMYKHSRNVKEAHKLFMKIIGIAQSKTHNAKIPEDAQTLYMASLLHRWAKEQDQNWLGYYSGSKFKKPNSGALKDRNVIKYYEEHRYGKKYPLARVSSCQQRLRKESGKKPRWNKDKREYKIQERDFKLRMSKRSL